MLESEEPNAKFVGSEKVKDDMKASTALDREMEEKARDTGPHFQDATFSADEVPELIPKDFFKQVAVDLEKSRVDLIGVTEHTVPYVSDEAILQTLREHNVVLTFTRHDVDRHDDELEAAREVSKLLHASLQQAERNIERQFADLAETKGRLEVAENNIVILQAKVSGLDDLEETVRSQGMRITTLHDTTGAMDARFTKRFETNEQSLSKVEMRVLSVEGAASRLEGRVDKLKEELIVPAHNVTLPLDLQAEAEAGGSEDESSHLTHLLGIFRDQLESHEATVERQRKMLEEHAEAIDGKASVDIEDAVRAHASHLEGVQSKMDADAECDLPAMLADLKEAEQQLLNILEQLKCKVSYDDVDVKVEARYTEILSYLQSTLHATEDDDDDVRRETSELRDALNEMRMTKADRGDLAQLRAQIASQVDDAMGATEIENVKLELDSRPKRVEVFELLTNKVSFADLKRSLSKIKLHDALEHGDDFQHKGKPTLEINDSVECASIRLTDSKDTKKMAKQKHLHMPSPDQACATARGYGDFKRPCSASLDTIPSRQCLSCETPLINVNTKLSSHTKVLGAGFLVTHAPLGTLAPLEHVPAGSKADGRPLYVSAIPPPTVAPN